MPSGLNWFFEFLAFMFFVDVVVAGLGTTTLAAIMSVIQLNSVAFMPAFALASAGAILVGQHIGAERKDAVPRIVGLTFRATATWQSLAGLAYLTIPAILLRPFAPAGTPDSEALLEIGVGMLMLSAAWQISDAAVAAFAEALRAAGDTSFTLWARLAIAWLVFAPGSYVSVRSLGGGSLVAVAWVVAYLSLLALVLFLRFRGGAWRRIRLVAPPIA
jgi:MATE family multidrug resistance protein